MATHGPQSIIFGSGDGFFLRANIWAPTKLAGAFRSHEERLYSYGNTHDHNFSFLTVGYFGPGYTTDLYSYDRHTVKGYIGERVELEFLERTALTLGKTMLYREKVDVHTQFPPSALSISLNFMVVSDAANNADQYIFDPVASTIIDMPAFAPIYKRASMVSLAGSFGNEDAVNIISDLVRVAPCRRVRQSAIEGIVNLRCISDVEKIRLISAALDDTDSLVRYDAKRRIDELAL